jgi:serine phosphatase RsbU (regulator of sigma subunit)/anti-sigma regulatory factor (Ser/Thr protein kinase)
MITLIRRSWLSLFGRKVAPVKSHADKEEPASIGKAVEFEIAPDDPLLAHLLGVSSVVEVDALDFNSPVLSRLKEAGVKVVVPLISQGELVGLLNLGPRRSEQEYSPDDHRLLNTLAAQAAPALRVAQLARQQQSEARERERLAQELRVARVIQQTLLPKEIPQIAWWQMAAHWQPARAVSGDFYDFIPFPDGRFGVIVGDVTDKGVPAALVMATTRGILRTAAERLVAPGAVLAQVNNNLCPDIPPNMFVTCLYALIDPRTGLVRFANAGHNLPFLRGPNGVVELRARGMPLGLMPEMDYEEKEICVSAGEQLVLYSDGLVEAHDASGAMFGVPRLRAVLEQPMCGADLIDCLLSSLKDFTSHDWEQEDDVTFVTISREGAGDEGQPPEPEHHSEQAPVKRLAAFEIPSQPGNERQAIAQVVNATAGLNMPDRQLQRLKTAVGETTMNAMEHGNQYQPDQMVKIEVLLDGEVLIVRITDQGDSPASVESEIPDLDAKLAGLQSPRGWGLFLIKNMVDEMQVFSGEGQHTVELMLHLKGEA